MISAHGKLVLRSKEDRICKLCSSWHSRLPARLSGAHAGMLVQVCLPLRSYCSSQTTLSLAFTSWQETMLIALHLQPFGQTGIVHACSQQSCDFVFWGNRSTRSNEGWPQSDLLDMVNIGLTVPFLPYALACGIALRSTNTAPRT